VTADRASSDRASSDRAATAGQAVGAAAPAAAPGPVAAGAYAERMLATRIIDTLLREDYGGLAARVRRRDGGAVLDLPTGRGSPGRSLPLERDGFLADLRLLRTAAGLPASALTLHDVDAAVAAVSDPRDQAGVAAFAAECRQALAALRLRERHPPAALGRVAGEWRAVPDARCGPRGLLGYEALAALRPHPAYPTSESRLGFSDEDTVRYAPEYYPRFELHWVAVPRTRLTVAGRLTPAPAGWPAMPQVGLPEALAETHDLLPVHPVTARDQLNRALAEAGLPLVGLPVNGLPVNGDAAGGAVVAPGTALRAIPTLSTRTVAVAGQPGTHLKLPLPTSTLGLLNRRLISPGTLADGALVRGILDTAIGADPLLHGLLLADESSYAHAGHPYLGYLLRRLPAGLDWHRIVPVAALLAPGPDAAAETGRPLVIEELARWTGRGDLSGLLTAYLRTLFGVQVRLFTRYGIALESHQQNAAVVLAPPAIPAIHHAAGSGNGTENEASRLRLLVKDFDGALIHLPRLTAGLGPGTPRAGAFADPRLLTTSDDALADVFITITVHLCAGALAFGLAERGVAPLPDLLALVRRELTAALDRHADCPAAALLRARVLDADRLPGKSMLTAGTLVAKSRTGASDINKFYGTNGPNYLKDAFMRNCR
jgi:siderophore synthetase component